MNKIKTEFFKNLKSKMLAEQQGQCAWCLKGRYCIACEQNKPHKGDHCIFQEVNTFDHNHKCCPSGTYCEKCIRGVVHNKCNFPVIGFIEQSPHLQTEHAKQYLNRGKP